MLKNKKLLFITIGISCIVFLSVLAYWTVIPRQGTLDIPGEGIYNGQLRGHIFHGYGTYTSYVVGGTSYEGEWKDGVFHGQGTLTYANGSKLTGEFRNGSIYGVATIICPSGEFSEYDFSERDTDPGSSCSCCGHD
jgi:hypothetical protein